MKNNDTYRPKDGKTERKTETPKKNREKQTKEKDRPTDRQEIRKI